MSNRSVWLDRLAVSAAAVIVVWGIGSYGIWDPWELIPADAARLLARGGTHGSGEPTLSIRLIGAAFTVFGVHEWSARLPGVLAGLISCGLAYLLVQKSCDRRTAVVTTVVLATTPAFLLNARLVMGEAIGVAAQCWVAVAAIATLDASKTTGGRIASYFMLAASIAVSTVASGVMLGPLPPLLAFSVWSFVSEERGRVAPSTRWSFAALAIVGVAAVARAVTLDAAEPSQWLGGGAVGGNPPTYDAVLELVFHGLAPWSAVLPVAAVWVAAPRPGRSVRAQSLAWLFLLWSVFAAASWTLFASRYGVPPVLALVPMSGVVGLWISETAEEPAARWPAAVLVVLLMGLLIRDYALYPDIPLRALPVSDLTMVDVYDPRRDWAALFTLTGIVLGLFLVSYDGLPRPNAGSVVRWLRSHWRTGWAPRLWLLLGGWVLVMCLAFGALCFLIDFRMASVIIRVGRAALFVPFALAALVFGLPWLRYAYGKLGAAGRFPVLACGLAVGAFVVFSFQPALSQHFSPKVVYQAYVELSEGRSEPLAVFQASAAAARQYTSSPVEEIGRRSELLAFLGEQGPRWAVIDAQQLPALDRAYRRKTGNHLFVADSRSARLLLIASTPVAGRPNANFLEATVRREAPPIEHPVEASYDDRIELLGYDLTLPGDGAVGAGQEFELTWYWKASGDPPPGYEVFVHIDGQGLRLNGDHEPVQGRYPTKLWELGDVIVDRQELEVPVNFVRGDYPIYVGWFKGDKRLEVRSGPQDGDNRVRVGILPVR